ncbi:MAG: UDP-N-acetylmuramoyl-L-alanine--D-glutamate ligase [Lachnospiraceae bacterium]|nr:UDP-N-acetylmuramoyl-L-alanine--D-glutamate ligase [Lachnospiraceae bacterium]
MELNGKTVIVMGAGKSGIAAAKLLLQVGAFPVIYDQNEKLDVAALRQQFTKEIAICAGTLEQEYEQAACLLVMSPGIPVDTDFVEGFRKRGIPVWGEIELAYRYAKGRLIAITGTNGKTTTTALTGKIMQDWYERSGREGKVYVAGNIGDPYTDIALLTKEGDTTVLEVSSFQLETIDAFHPEISAILNITPDHLNRHHTMENYAACKFAVTKNQTPEEVCVLNGEDAWLQGFVREGKCACRPVYFDSAKPVVGGYWQEGKEIFSSFAEKKRLMNIHEMKLLGTHNVENVMAAIAMADAAGVPMESILQSVRDFTAVEHRIEYTATVDGVDYYNDSKGTNPDAAIKAVQAMVKPTVLIGGGYDKQNTYDEWIESFGDKVRCLLLLGQTREKIEACAHQHGFLNTVLVESMEEAVSKAHELAEPGWAVLLSPACASWGMFQNYEERGRIFKELVRKL